MSTPVILLYGAGPNVGLSVLTKFRAEGWKTAAVVRTERDEYKKSVDLVIKADFADSESITQVYQEVSSKLGTPNCVVYNAYSAETFAADTSKPFAASVAAMSKDFAINTISFYAAASAAAAGFETIANDTAKSFIYTGNGFKTSIVPEMPGLGAGKSASAYLLELAANALGSKSHWYFADERLPNGKPIMTNIGGESHAEAYYELATGKEQGPWDYTFVKGQGYKKFADAHDHGYTPIGELMKEIGK